MNSLTKVLLVEDDLELSESLSDILRYGGIECNVINDGQVALDWLDTHTPSAVVLDMHLPHVSGLDIMDYMRNNDRLKHLPVIVITADAGLVDILQGNAEMVLLKPVRYAQLDSIVELLSGIELNTLN